MRITDAIRGLWNAVLEQYREPSYIKPGEVTVVDHCDACERNDKPTVRRSVWWTRQRIDRGLLVAPDGAVWALCLDCIEAFQKDKNVLAVSHPWRGMPRVSD